MFCAWHLVSIAALRFFMQIAFQLLLERQLFFETNELLVNDEIDLL
jgi:hypothetical protein